MYGKIFTSLWNGSLRGQPDEQLVFMYLFANCDRDGDADVHPSKIADDTGLSLERVQAALTRLESEDPESRSPAEGGRRIVLLDEHRDWGWRVVNYPFYRGVRDEEDRREQNRLAKQRQRAEVSRGQPASATVSHGQPRSAYTDADADAEACSRARSALELGGGPAEHPKSKSLGPSLEAGEPSRDVVIELPTNRPGVSFQVTRALVRECEALYPAVDVGQQFRTMRGWLLGNPKKRKTVRGMARFIAAWLGDKQDKAGGIGGPQPGQRGHRFRDDKGMTAAGIEAAAAQMQQEEARNGKG